MSDFSKNNWSFSNNYDWTRKFPTFGGDFQSPINIDTSKLMDIGNLKELTVGFTSSKCFVMTKNKYKVYFYYYLPSCILFNAWIRFSDVFCIRHHFSNFKFFIIITLYLNSVSINNSNYFSIKICPSICT